MNNVCFYADFCKGIYFISFGVYTCKCSTGTQDKSMFNCWELVDLL